MRTGTNYKAQSLPDLISRAQIQLIKIAQKEIGMEDEAYREMLMAHFKVSSCTQLTKAQATRLIERFEAFGFETRNKTPRSRGNHPGWTRSRSPQRATGRDDGKIVRLVSFQELGKIDILAALIDWEFEDGLARWMEKRFGIFRVRTAREAWLVIEGLKKMFSNRMARLWGKEWWDKQFDDPRIMRFIVEHRPKERKGGEQ